MPRRRQHVQANMLCLLIKVKIRKRRVDCKAYNKNPMADDVAFDDVDDWTLAKRKRVEASLLDDSVTGVTQYEQIAFKRYIGRAMNGCDMFWVWIKLPAAGA